MSGAAEALLPLVRHLCGGDPPLCLRLWDGSEIAPAAAPGAGNPSAAAPGAGDPSAADPAGPGPGRDPGASDGATIVISSPSAVRRILWQPNELGLARAYVAGEIEVQGDIYALFRLEGLLSSADRPDGWRARLEGGRQLFAAARACGAL
ncbi:MAG TPA: hypothetical protein VLA35_09315, partial [Thermoleophilia bacterium]|nr:hypothetical protein [Thermoleophilia bacterium]